MKKILSGISLISMITIPSLTVISCKTKPRLSIKNIPIYVGDKFVINVGGKWIRNTNIKIDGDVIQILKKISDREFQFKANKVGTTKIILAGEIEEYWYSAIVGNIIIPQYYWVYHENIEELTFNILERK